MARRDIIRVGSEEGGGRGIGRSNISRPKKKYLFKRRIGGDGVSADADLVASALTAATVNNGQKNIFVLLSGRSGSQEDGLGGSLILCCR